MDKRDLTYIIQAHDDKSRDPRNRFRKWDRRTPFYIHPIWCASMIRQETSLSEETRIQGSQVLLYHDVLEDTEAGLPKWVSGEVKSLVYGMTFESSEDEWENLWERSREIRLLKLYDKVNNLMDGIWMKQGRRQQHLDHLKKLCEDVEKNYGELNITRLARTLF